MAAEDSGLHSVHTSSPGAQDASAIRGESLPAVSPSGSTSPRFETSGEASTQGTQLGDIASTAESDVTVTESRDPLDAGEEGVSELDRPALHDEATPAGSKDAGELDDAELLEQKLEGLLSSLEERKRFPEPEPPAESAPIHDTSRGEEANTQPVRVDDQSSDTQPAGASSPSRPAAFVPPRPPRIPPTIPIPEPPRQIVRPDEDLTVVESAPNPERRDTAEPYSLRELYGRMRDKYRGLLISTDVNLDQVARRLGQAFAGNNMAEDPDIQAIRAIHEAILPHYFGYDRVEDMPQDVQHNVQGLFDQLAIYMVFAYTPRGEDTTGEQLITKMLDRLVEETKINPLYRGGKWFAKEVVDVGLSKGLPKGLSKDFHRFVNRELLRRPHYLVPMGKEGFTYSPAPPIITFEDAQSLVERIPLPDIDPQTAPDRWFAKNRAQDTAQCASGPYGIALCESGGPLVQDGRAALIASGRLQGIVGRIDTLHSPMRPEDLAKELAEARRDINREWRRERRKEGHPTDAVAVVTTIGGRAFLIGESTGARVYIHDRDGHVVPVTLSPAVAELHRTGAIKTDRQANELQQAIDESTTTYDMQSVMVRLALEKVDTAIKNGDRRVRKEVEQALRIGEVFMTQGKPAHTLEDVGNALVNLQEALRTGQIQEIRRDALQAIQSLLPSHLQHLWPIVHDERTGEVVYPRNSTKNVQTFAVPIEPGWEVIITDAPAALVQEVAWQLPSESAQVKAQTLIQASRQVGHPRQFAAAVMQVPRIGTGSHPLSAGSFEHHTRPYPSPYVRPYASPYARGEAHPEDSTLPIFPE